MFTVGFYKKAMVISTSGVDKISIENIQELRRLVIQVLRNPSGKLIIALNQVKEIDQQAFDILDRLYNLAERQGVIVEFTNLNEELTKELQIKASNKEYRIAKQIIFKSTDKEKEGAA